MGAPRRVADLRRTRPKRVPLRDSITDAKVYEVTTIRLEFRSGWAVFRIDEGLGSLSIESDWGSYSYIWGHGGRSGDTLQQFLARADANYVAGKLLAGRRAEMVDGAATRRAMTRHARDLFKEGRIRSVTECWGYGENEFEIFRSLVSEIQAFTRRVDGESTTQVDVYNNIGELLAKVFDPIWEWVHTELPSWHQFLYDELCPTFRAYLRGEIDGYKPPGATPRAGGAPGLGAASAAAPAPSAE